MMTDEWSCEAWIEDGMVILVINMPNGAYYERSFDTDELDSFSLIEDLVNDGSE